MRFIFFTILWFVYTSVNVETTEETKSPNQKWEISNLRVRRSSSPKDCCDVFKSGKNTSGVYKIYPNSKLRGVEAYCDMTTSGGGWTVFLARMQQEFKISFYRNWRQYKTGFGSADGEHWLGNVYLSTLTRDKNYVLRLDAESEYDDLIWGEWGQFKVESEESMFRLLVSGFNANSTCGPNLMGAYNTNDFSTIDKSTGWDYLTDCTRYRWGGWWHNNCFPRFNPTGTYGGLNWYGLLISPWSKDKSDGQASTLKLKIRPKECHL